MLTCDHINAAFDLLCRFLPEKQPTPDKPEQFLRPKAFQCSGRFCLSFSISETTCLQATAIVDQDIRQSCENHPKLQSWPILSFSLVSLKLRTLPCCSMEEVLSHLAALPSTRRGIYIIYNGIQQSFQATEILRLRNGLCKLTNTYSNN